MFGRHDLIQDAPIGRISLLTCRNALMYFNPETQARVLERLSFAMAEPGVLVLGARRDAAHPQPRLRPARPALPDLPPRGPAPASAACRTPAGAPLLGKVAQAAFVSAAEAQLVLDAEGGLALVNEAAVRAFARRAGRRGPAVPGPRGQLPPRRAARRHRGGRPRPRGRRGQGRRAWAASRPARWYDVQVVPLLDGPERPARRADHLPRRHALPHADRPAGHRAPRARDRVRGAAVLQRGARDDERGAAERCRGARDHQRGAAEHQRGARDDERGAAEHQRGAADPQRRAARAHGRGQPGQRVPREHPHRAARRRRGRRRRARRPGVERARRADVGAARPRGHRLALPQPRHRPAGRGPARRAAAGAVRRVEHLDLRVASVNRFGRKVQCAIGISPLRSYLGAITGAIVLMEENDGEPAA